MNVLCPNCRSSVPVNEGNPVLDCPSCGLMTDLSKMGTLTGAGAPPLIRDRVGDTVGGYALDERIGIGGMGVVYKAHRADDSEPVALKLLHPSYSWKPSEFVARFDREAEALTRLNHPNIVKLLDSGQDGDAFYLVTEHIRGPNLAQYLRQRKPDPAETLGLALQICRALSYAHGQGIIHRDIKPANLIISGRIAKVLDFGLAQIAGADSQMISLTRTDLAMGTFNYLSPEQRVSAKRVDARSDLFSLGVVLFEMLTGTLPLGSFDPPSRLVPSLDRRWDRIVNRLLKADPDRRYQTVDDLAAKLSELDQRPGRKKWLAWSAAACAAGALAAVVALGFVSPEEKEIPFPKIKGQRIEAQQVNAPPDTAPVPVPSAGDDATDSQQARIQALQPQIQPLQAPAQQTAVERETNQAFAPQPQPSEKAAPRKQPRRQKSRASAEKPAKKRAATRTAPDPKEKRPSEKDKKKRTADKESDKIPLKREPSEKKTPTVQPSVSPLDDLLQQSGEPVEKKQKRKTKTKE